MFDTLAPIDTQVLDDLRAARADELIAAARQLRLAADWADLHPVARRVDAAGWGPVDLQGERVAMLAGDGTPLVAEFAPAELAAQLRISLDAGKLLIGDALELRHRLPRLWDLVHSLEVPAWRARQVASLTSTLTWEMVVRVDKLVSCDPAHLTLPLIKRIVDDAELFYDPDRAGAREQSALKSRHVTLIHDRCPATTDVTMRLDTEDALALDATVREIAAGLSQLGDCDELDVRRARAVGVLADPQRALDLLTDEPDESDEPAGSGAAARPQPDPHAARPESRTRRNGHSRTELFLHVDAADLADPTTGAISDTLGVLTRDLLASWLGRPDASGVVVRPVLDLGSTDTVDAHDPPGWMRGAAFLRDATCVFPGCTHTSSACDLDHIEAYVPPARGGPPGQTSLANLAPLCRPHHRVKTFTAWTYVRLTENHYVWTTPAGELIHVRTHRRRRRP